MPTVVNATVLSLIDMAKRGRVNHSDEWDITGVIGLRLNSRSAHAKLQDQQ